MGFREDGLWGGIGGDSFWGTVGLGDSDNRYTLSQGMMGIAQGLLSERQGEGWGAALGRGFGQAQRNTKEAHREIEFREEERRQDDLRTFMAGLAADPNNTPEDAAILDTAAKLGGAPGGSIVAQWYAQNQANRNYERRRGSREADAKDLIRFRTEQSEDKQIRREERDLNTMEGQNEQQEALILGHIRRDPQASAMLGLQVGSPLPPELDKFYKEMLKRTPKAQFEGAIYDALGNALQNRTQPDSPASKIPVPGNR
jgi:hypothetical protein